MKIDTYRELQKQFTRLGRGGISQRAHDLVTQYVEEYPEIHYKEVCELMGRLHALFLVTPPGEYWREVASRGFCKEMEELPEFEYVEGPKP